MPDTVAEHIVAGAVVDGAPAVSVPVQLGAFSQAQILLIGTGRYRDGSGLPDVSAVADTVTDLAAALVERCGVPASAVRTLIDPPTAQVMGEAVAEAAELAKDLLLVYYVGHGLVSPDGGLFLAACASEAAGDRRVSRVPVTALSYAFVRNLVLDSRARSRIVVLDCCFSGRALDGLTDPAEEVANLAQVAGGFVLTSAGGEEVALAPVGERHTAFTGALLRLLETGDARCGPWVTLQDVYQCLAVTLPAAGRPRPRRRAEGRVGELALTANPAYRPPVPADSVVTSPVAPVVRVACPYKGLAAFEPADEALFHGRTQVVGHVARALTARVDAPRTLVVTGASGSGKSSLLHAGVLPAIGRGALAVAGSSQWPRVWCTPTADPLGILASCLLRDWSDGLVQVRTTSDAPEIAQEVDRLRENPTTTVARLVAQQLHDHGFGDLPGSRLVLIVDQFEELFTLCDRESDRRAFIQALCHLAGNESDTPALVVIGIRADLYGRCTSYPELATALEGDQIVLRAMTFDQTRAAIEQPARLAGLALEPGLVDLLLDDLGADADITQPFSTAADLGPVPGSTASAYEPGRLPLLAHALRQTWQRSDGRVLTVADYRRTGGIRAALAESADRVLASFDESGQMLARQLLLSLVHVSEGSDDARRRVSRADLLAKSHDPVLASTVLDAFAGETARLITMDYGTVEITHEALLRSWPVLRGWIEQDRAGLVIGQQLIDAAFDWDRSGRDPSMLYGGTRLALAVEWAGATELRQQHPPAVAVEFLQDSRAAESHRRQRELAEQVTRRRARQARIAAIVMTLLTIVAVGASVVAYKQAGEANQQHALALSRLLAAESQAISTSEPVPARRLAAAAWQIAPTEQARTAMANVIADQRSVLVGHLDQVLAVSFSPDGKLLASASSDRSVRLWNPATGEPVGNPLTGHTEPLWDVAFSPNGKLLASGGVDKTVRLWNPATGKPVGNPLTGHSDAVIAVAFSPDGKLLASASDDKTLRLWNPATGEPVGNPLTGHSDAVYAVAFSPDGKLLASAGGDQTLRLWNPATGEPVGNPLTGHTDPVWDVTFSPDGKLLASASVDRTARLWNPATGQQVGDPLVGHTDPVWDVAFSPDGKLLASASSDQTVRLWNPATGQPVGAAMTGHTSNVIRVAFSPDGKLLASASSDKTVRLWEPGTGQRVGAPMTGHADHLVRVAFSPDGKLLASAGSDKTVRLWDADTRQPHGALLTGHTDHVYAVAFSPDGKLLAGASSDKTVRLWNPATGQPVGEPVTGHTDQVLAVAFSPNGNLLASAGTDQTVRLWDPTTRRQVGAALTGHTDNVLAVAFSPNGNLLASVSADKTIRLWNPATGQPVGRPLTGHTDPVYAVAFSPNGKLLASAGDDKTIRLWNPATGEPVGDPLTGHTDPVYAVTFSPNGKMLASASADRTARLWNPSTGEPIGAPLTGHTGATWDVAFSPDGKMLASASADNTVRLWNWVDYVDPHGSLCARFGPPTNAEWQKYAPNEPLPRICG